MIFLNKTKKQNHLKLVTCDVGLWVFFLVELCKANEVDNVEIGLGASFFERPFKMCWPLIDTYVLLFFESAYSSSCNLIQ